MAPSPTYSGEMRFPTKAGIIQISRVLVQSNRGLDWIGQKIDWKPIIELWRFYQSGQLVHYFGMVEAWDEKSTGKSFPSSGEYCRA